MIPVFRNVSHTRVVPIIEIEVDIMDLENIDLSMSMDFIYSMCVSVCDC